MGRYNGKQCRMVFMLSFTVSYFLVEIIVGHIVNSVALVADSFHMLSDVVALCVGLASVKISKRGSKSNTFGWIRAEVLGALVNAVFLIALCFSIFVKALQRLTDPEKIDNPKLMLIVGGIGLLINVIGLFMFHGGHGHSHGGGGHSHEETKPLHKEATANGTVEKQLEFSDDGSSSMSSDHGSKSGKKIASSAQLNMRGVFLHVLGDALGSVIVIISALVIWLVDKDNTDPTHWKYKLDPAMSLMMVIIILCTTAPLLRESGHILLQRVPGHIKVHELKSKLLTTVKGIHAIHEFHIWQLAGNRIIATAHMHIQCNNLEEYFRINEEVKDFFHKAGIHSTTIQSELMSIDEADDLNKSRDCDLECGPNKDCYKNTCCATNTKINSDSREMTPPSDVPDSVVIDTTI